METVKDRLIQFIEYKGINPHSFEKRCGLATSFVANMRNSMQPDKMMSIAQNFPDLNFDWLCSEEALCCMKTTKYCCRMRDLESIQTSKMRATSEVL